MWDLGMCGTGRGLPVRTLDRENARLCEPGRMGDQESTQKNKETQGKKRKRKETEEKRELMYKP